MKTWENSWKRFQKTRLIFFIHAHMHVSRVSYAEKGQSIFLRTKYVIFWKNDNRYLLLYFWPENTVWHFSEPKLRRLICYKAQITLPTLPLFDFYRDFNNFHLHRASVYEVNLLNWLGLFWIWCSNQRTQSNILLRPDMDDQIATSLYALCQNPVLRRLPRFLRRSIWVCL